MHTKDEIPRRPASNRPSTSSVLARMEIHDFGEKQSQLEG
jgi:hypothetical protein